MGRDHRRGLVPVVAFALLSQIPTSAAAPETNTGTPGTSPERMIRALIVTGVDVPAHRWRAKTAAIQEVLQSGSRMKADVLNDPNQLGTVEWKNYDVVVLNFYNRDTPSPDKKAREDLRNFIDNGGGLVVFHSAAGAFADWPEYKNLAAQVWDREERSKINRVGPMRVKIANPEHPITKGLNDYETVDELFTDLKRFRNVTTLAIGDSKGEKGDRAAAYAHEYGRGRVFNMSLGHTPEAVRNAGTAELLRRGCAWAAGR